MPDAGFTAWQWLGIVQHELLLFAAVFFLIGSVDELVVDFTWLWLKVTGRARDGLVPEVSRPNLAGRAAVFIAAWREEAVIGATVAHALRVWPHRQLRLYVGCYRNDRATIAALLAVGVVDPRLRLVIHPVDGPTTKADCLNRLYRALQEDEARTGLTARMVVLHDAEDLVDPAALGLLDRALDSVELAQVPVLPLPQSRSRWIGSHYIEEFAEAHAKSMVVRDALGAGMPLAGVGCAIRRDALGAVARDKPGALPFAADCLTEDYELGLGIAEKGGSSRFLRYRTGDGRLVATRAYFPARLDDAVRQKTRWVHGIAFQAWDRLGWHGRPAEIWMRLRDRRGPLAALVLAAAYALLGLSAAVWATAEMGLGEPIVLSGTLVALLWLNFASFVWRAIWRFGFTMREYGWREGIRAVLRIPVANIIAIMAGRRAIAAYLRSLGGKELVWDKTEHHDHPAFARPLGRQGLTT